MNHQRQLKAVGYWRMKEYPPDVLAEFPQLAQLEYQTRLPEPQNLVDPLWRPDERAHIASYLRDGKVAASWNGSARCRICPEHIRLGDSDLSDGEWIWPQRLEHYIEEHNLRLPDEFIETMHRNGWQVLGGPSHPFEEGWKRDYTFWMTWATAVKDGLV